MTPAQAIAALDRQVDKHGQAVELRRIVANAEDATSSVKGFVRGYKPDEIGGGIVQGDSLVVLSPTGLAGSVFVNDPPRRLDEVVTAGVLRSIESAELVYLADVLVRINLQVRG